MPEFTIYEEENLERYHLFKLKLSMEVEYSELL